MPDVFKPIQVVEKPGQDIKSFEVHFSDENLGQLAIENTKLKLFLADQQGRLEGHLAKLKEAAVDEYASMFGTNSEAINKALETYAAQMNQLLERSVAMLNQVITKLQADQPDLFRAGSNIQERYAEVAKEFGPKLEAMIKGDLNRQIADIIDAADEETPYEHTIEAAADDLGTREERIDAAIRDH